MISLESLMAPSYDGAMKITTLGTTTIIVEIGRDYSLVSLDRAGTFTQARVYQTKEGPTSTHPQEDVRNIAEASVGSFR